MIRSFIDSTDHHNDEGVSEANKERYNSPCWNFLTKTITEKRTKSGYKKLLQIVNKFYKQKDNDEYEKRKARYLSGGRLKVQRRPKKKMPNRLLINESRSS